MISTKGRYALRVMIDLAEHKEEGYITLKAISERQDISKKYLEILVKKLVAGKLISSTSGKGGGYQLTRPPEQYTVGEILELMEGTLATVACLTPGAPPCERAKKCKTLGLWSEYNQLIHNFFYSKTLKDLL